MKRAAKSLVERRTERFESLHPLTDSVSRLAATFDRMRVVPGERFVPQWHEEAGHAVLDAQFLPPRGIQGFVRAASLFMFALIVASAYLVLRTHEGAARFLLPFFTVLVILGFPIVTLALNSQREAHESRIRRAIRVALLDADERLPPPQRWADED
jgi:hypothetical protein